jgi:hypothetical protein
LVGAVLAFTPRRLAESFLARHLQRSREFTESLMKDKK